MTDDRPVAEQVREALDWFSGDTLGEAPCVLDVTHGLTLATAYRALRAEHERLTVELDTLKASIHDLSHPNCQMLLRDVDALRQRVTELDQQRESAFRAGYTYGCAEERVNCDFAWKMCSGQV